MDPGMILHDGNLFLTDLTVGTRGGEEMRGRAHEEKLISEDIQVNDPIHRSFPSRREKDGGTRHANPDR